MTTLLELNVVLVGCGRMGSALTQGAFAAGAIDAKRLYCVDTNEHQAQQLATSLGAHVGQPDDGERALWVLAVKPHHIDDAIRASAIGPDDVVISVAAGIRTPQLRDLLPKGATLIRAMPNTPALVGEGITGVLASFEGRAHADALFGAVGEVVHLTDEAQFDAVTAVSGSGPAFVFVAIEALADGGVAMGLPREMATKLAIQTVLGAATLARTEKVHVAELKDRVASPGGTTIAGLAALEHAGFRAALIEAVRAATLRGRELGEG